MGFLADFNTFIDNNHLLKNEDRVLLAVSGGVDSMAMAAMFLQSDRSFGVAHCNFQLRNNESDLDEALVASWCEENGVHFHSKRFATQEYASEHGISLQMAARNLRYDWFRTVMDLEDYSKLATAHHSDDNLETVLFNLTRGTGFAGIAGIPVKAKRIIRPLLFATREEIVKYAKEANVLWREDQSNLDQKYSRSVIRAEVVPELEKINPSIRHSFKNTSRRLSEMKELVMLQIKKELAEMVSHENGTLRINKEQLIKSRGASTVLYEIIKGYGYNYETCLQILSSLDNIGAIFKSASHVLNVDRKELLLTLNDVQESNELFIDSNTRSFYLSGVRYLMEVVSVDDSLSINDPDSAVIDFEQVSFPLRFRRWEKGDRFTPIGMQGSKKVSDLLIDLKVPNILKSSVYVLCSGTDIVWVCRYRLSENFKVTPATKKVIKIYPEKV